jgi:8-oxo-dGTP pyrophosphatase MutT (NUDIX family)
LTKTDVTKTDAIKTGLIKTGLTKTRLIDPASAAAAAANMSTHMASDEFFRRARERLNFTVPPGLTDAAVLAPTGDFGTDMMLRTIAQERPVRPAAVLVPIVARDEPTVLLTKRAEHLNEHAGQISFPGGKIDATDLSPLDAALREADEEIGLKRAFIDPIGYLDVYATGFGFRILPTLAQVRPGFDLAVSANEVDDVFEVPLSFLMDPVNHKLGSKEFRGLQRSFYEMPFEQRYIWGATAGMLRALYERIYLP